MDTQMFRDAMASLGAAVSVITTDGPSGRAGLTMTAVCSVTDAPPTILVCINRDNRSYRRVHENGVLCVNVLSAAQQELAARFAKSSVIDRFEGVPCSPAATGAPALEGAMVNIDCRVARTVDIGTHAVFFCEVAAIARSDGSDGLFYFGRRYQTLASHSLRAVETFVPPKGVVRPDAASFDAGSLRIKKRGREDACKQA